MVSNVTNKEYVMVVDISSPINLVSDFSSGLFAKTPSEESGGGGRAGGTPPLTASSLSQDSSNPQISPGPGGLMG